MDYQIAHESRNQQLVPPAMNLGQKFVKGSSNGIYPRIGGRQSCDMQLRLSQLARRVLSKGASRTFLSKVRKEDLISQEGFNS
jgi:hypothetical protein